MVAMVRAGVSMRAVARRYQTSLCTVQRWVGRAGPDRLDRVDWSDRPRVAKRIGRTTRELEDVVLSVRAELRATSDLGEYGAAAIHRALRDQHVVDRPAVRTINRILARRGAFDGRRRIRRPPPPRGWYLPEAAAGRAELDSFDVVTGLVIQGGPHVEVLNAISLHGSLIGSWPADAVTARSVVAVLIEHWQAVGLPTYAQFDNDTRFEGAHQHRDAISRVMRVCLGLGVVPVFTPVNEPSFQAALENLNGRWQSKVWARFHHDSLVTLIDRSDRFVRASRVRAAARIETAPPRQPFPRNWQFDLHAPPRGRIIFLRRSNEQGGVRLLGRTFPVDPLWPHRLVRCEVDLDAHVIRCYALRRRQPDDQPLLHEISHLLPQRRFRDRP
jgi:hypothetical protein